MATGGTIPNNRSQSVTFYDTTGIIERHKNIYYAPVFEEAGDTDIRNAYLSRFNEVCPPSSAYTDIDISSWSPQDRTLVVRGNIDDFRLVTDEGACLNYFIITRRITKGESIETYYYGFFITGVSQAGGSSITITAEPDDFTNVFYLHNRDTLTVGYDPFNKKMSNCYVNRQHYDRVKVTSWAYRLSIINMTLTPNFINIGDSISIFEDEGGSLLLSGIVKDYLIDDLQPRNMQITITVESQPSAIEDNTSIGIHVADNAPFYGDVSSGSIERTIGLDNMEIFVNQEESFRYKYQYRDLKYPISYYDGIFTQAERTLIDNAEEIEDLPLSLRNKVVLCCISYLVIETKSPEILYSYKLTIGKDTTDRKLVMGEHIENGVNRPNPIVCFPFINSPAVFKKFNLENKTQFRAIINGYHESSASGEDAYRNYLIKRIIKRINSKAVADYIYSVYITNNILFPKENYNISYWHDSSVGDVLTIRYSLSMPETWYWENEEKYIDDKGVYASGLKSSISGNEAIYEYKDSESSEVTSMSFNTIGIIVSGYEKQSININLTDLDKPSAYKLINNYYDTVLTTEPYSFYTISTLASYELTLPKNRYYQKYNFVVDYYISINGAIKISYIPNYTINNIDTPYFNEGLTFTSSSSLPIMSDSYSSYYNQNKAQMKNQYAVNNFNRGIDLLQHFGISGPNAVGYSASRRGGYGALAETGNQVMQMIDEGIDWAQSNKEIEMNQKAKLADMGAKPDTLKQVGSDIIYDLKTDENYLFLNHYTIDELSYNSIAKLLERTGYQVNLYDELHTYDRVGWNFIKLNGFDWNPDVNIMVSQEESIRNIFIEGVTLLHDKNFLTSGHNYEKILKE